MDPAAPRKTNPWPFLAISLLVVLLSVFLFLQWRKREPAVVKRPEPAEPAREPDPGPPPVLPPAPAPTVDPGQEDFRRHLEGARKSIEEKRWREAQEALRLARAIRETPELKDLEERVKKGMAAEAEEARSRYDRELDALRRKVEEVQRKDAWEEALKLVQQFEAHNPAASEDETFRRLRERVRALQADADKAFGAKMAEARTHFQEGRFVPAIRTSDGARSFYPERKALVEEFQAGVRERMTQQTMVRVAGAAWVGNDDQADEKPARKVTLPPFFIDRYEVTNEEYFAFLSAKPRPAPPTWPGGQVPKTREKHPVTHVTYDDAAAYAAWAGKRLPTAEEWEVAARGPDRRVYPWGNQFAEKENAFHCNCWEYWEWRKGSSGRVIPDTTPVSSFDNANGESPYGVYGMGGNVWEWTSTAALRKVGDQEREFRVLKGGSFTTRQRAIRASNVYAENPALSFWDVGFRCARDAK